MQRWSDAVDCFSKATSLSRDFSFAAANKALALYQLGNKEEAIR
jgi:Flp pilus assembly protein TadD